MNMNNLARMAQQMQADMARAEQELREMTVAGTAGGGVVKAVVTGKQELVSLTLDPSVVDPQDVEMLQDLILAALHDATARLAELQSQTMGGVGLDGLDLGGMLGAGDSE